MNMVLVESLGGSEPGIPAFRASISVAGACHSLAKIIFEETESDADKVRE